MCVCRYNGFLSVDWSPKFPMASSRSSSLLLAQYQTFPEYSPRLFEKSTECCCLGEDDEFILYSLLLFSHLSVQRSGN